MTFLRIIYTAPTTNVRTAMNAYAIKRHSVYRKMFHIIGNENNCRFFNPYCTSRFACGIDHILDNIPYSTAITIRKELYSLMGRSMFYRIRNKERMLHPDEQKQITAVFLKHGIENKPEFDKYIDLFDW